MLREHALWLTLAIASVLLLASVIGAVLKWRTARGQAHEAIDNLNTRIRSWWVMAAVIGAALWAGKLATCALFVVLSLLALREYVTTASSPNARTWVMGLVICVVGIAHIPTLLWLTIPAYEGRNVLLVVYLVLITQASDVLQYIWGKLCGKHLIAPSVSPSKTVEGAIGGITCATLIGSSLWWVTPFTLTQAAGLSLMIAIAGFISGLIMSVQKRARGIKDWGSLIEGHGGILDRLDSLWLAAPLFYYCVRFAWITT